MFQRMVFHCRNGKLTRTVPASRGRSKTLLEVEDEVPSVEPMEIVGYQLARSDSSVLKALCRRASEARMSGRAERAATGTSRSTPTVG